MFPVMFPVRALVVSADAILSPRVISSRMTLRPSKEAA
jgi:hypothetical protein